MNQWTLFAEVIYHGQNLNPVTVHELIAHEVDRPSLIWFYWKWRGHANKCGHFLFLSSFNFEPFRSVNAIYPLVIDLQSFTTNENVNSSITVATVLLSDVSHLCL